MKLMKIYFIEEDLALNFNIMITTNSNKSLIPTIYQIPIYLFWVMQALLANVGEQKFMKF